MKPKKPTRAQLAVANKLIRIENQLCEHRVYICPHLFREHTGRMVCPVCRSGFDLGGFGVSHLMTGTFQRDDPPEGLPILTCLACHAAMCPKCKGI